MIIKDELFKGYEIHFDELSYKVCRVRTAEESGKEYLKTIGYYSSVANSVLKISKLLVESPDVQYTLKEYYDLLKGTHEEILHKLSDRLI